MRATKHGDYLTQLTRLPHLFPANAYLVREDDGLTLVDTALPGSGPAILAEAKRLGLPIVRVALTHAHGDHVGSLDELRAALPDAEVLIGARDARLLAGDTSLDPTEPQAKIRGWLVPRATKPTRLLQPGDRVGSLEVVASPGHTPGHVSYVDTRDGTLIAGDAFQTRGGIAVSGIVRPLFPFPAMGTWHRPTALESARALRGISPSRLAVGHGEVIEDPLAEMDRAISDAERAIGRNARAAA